MALNHLVELAITIPKISIAVTVFYIDISTSSNHTTNLNCCHNAFYQQILPSTVDVTTTSSGLHQDFIRTSSVLHQDFIIHQDFIRTSSGYLAKVQSLGLQEEYRAEDSALKKFVQKIAATAFCPPAFMYRLWGAMNKQLQDLLRRTNGSPHCLSDLRRDNTVLASSLMIKLGFSLSAWCHLVIRYSC